LSLQRKLDPEHRGRAEALIEASRTGAVDAEAALLAAVPSEAPADKGDRSAPRAFATWVCNGRRIDLEVDGQPISARHVHALEMLEVQYDREPPSAAEEGEEEEQPSEVIEDKKEPATKFKALSDWLGEGLKESVMGLAAGIRSEALSHGKNERFTQPQKIFDTVPAALKLHLPAPRPEAASPITVYGILDPLSATAQSASAALALFGMAFNAEVNLVLNPVLRTTEYPLKKYYREVIHWPEHLADGRRLDQLEDGVAVGSGRAEIPLATKHTLTAALHTLPTWLVTAHKAEHDMDNLRLVDVGNGKTCETTYMLRQLYVEGQALVLGEDGWPVATAKGLQIEVRAKGASEASDDTIVMGNLGYFQVHGDPGLYQVTLKSGLSNDTFEPASMPDLE
ncbi:unnamed protein product, partial [Polarella glacialis]